MAEKQLSPFGSVVDYESGRMDGVDSVYASQKLADSDTAHDARGLVVAILMSFAAWAVLGYFLLG